MEGLPQTTFYQGQNWFVCDYTGALIKDRFFVPDGKDNSGKVGCFCTLPVLLRHYADSGVDQAELNDLTDDLCKFYDQESIPIQPRLGGFPITSQSDLASYLSLVPQGQSWLLVNGSQSIDEYKPERKVATQKRPKNPVALKPVNVGKKTTQRKVYKLVQGAYVASANKKPAIVPIVDPLRTVRVLSAIFQSANKPAIFSAEGAIFICGLGKEGIPNPFMRAWSPTSAAMNDVLIFATKHVELGAPERQEAEPQPMEEEQEAPPVLVPPPEPVAAVAPEPIHADEILFE